MNQNMQLIGQLCSLLSMDLCTYAVRVQVPGGWQDSVVIQFIYAIRLTQAMVLSPTISV